MMSSGVSRFRRCRLITLTAVAALVGIAVASGARAVTVDPATRSVSAARILADWSNTHSDPEQVDVLNWAGIGGANLTRSYIADCEGGGRGGEYFGNANAVNNVGVEVALVHHNTGTWTSTGPGEVVIESKSGGCTNDTGVPIQTKYKFSDTGSWGDVIIVTRTFGFDSAFNFNVRPYIPRLQPISAFTQVLYPNSTGTLATAETLNCPASCVVSNPGWGQTGGWYAIHDQTNGGRGLLVVREPSAIEADLWIDWDSASYTNATSFLLRAPSSGFQAPLTETTALCFYTDETWPTSMRSALQLPSFCTTKRDIFSYPMPLSSRTGVFDYRLPSSRSDRSRCFGVKWTELTHAGEDWFAPEQTPVLSVADGKVVWATLGSSFPGEAIIIEHELHDGSSIYSVYMHLAPNVPGKGTTPERKNILVTTGDTVTRGQQIANGLVDQRYRGEPNIHLHWELRYFDSASDICVGSAWPGPGYVLGDPNSYVKNDRSYMWTNPSDYVASHAP